jgi:hypothetical protein
MMFVVPVATPVTTPVPLTLAIPLLALLQVPNGVPSVKFVVNVWQTATAPVTALGKGFTVTVVDVVQPVPSV